MKLKCDVVSKFNPKQIYGKKGDEVRLIYMDEVTAVVEKDGSRFPMRTEDLDTGEATPPETGTQKTFLNE